MDLTDPPLPRYQAAALSRSLRFALLALTVHTAASWAGSAGSLQRADPAQQRVSAPAAQLAGWVLDSRDNQDLPFMIVDKVNARVMLFDRSGRLQGAAPALLGLARGDDSTPGIGERPIASILPAERTTPAGRFVASLDRDRHGQELLWIDYHTALALHRVVRGKPSEQRLQRLESATPADNRVSYGCINVPAAFYDKLVSPSFAGSGGVVYILPETRSMREVFGAYEVGAHALPSSSPLVPAAGAK